jgi:hypothetical protein
MIRHSMKIFKMARYSKHSIMKKAGEIFFEIFIIVFAVSFSIWLHGITEHRKEQKEVRAFLTCIRSDISKDLKWLKDDVETFEKCNVTYKKIIQLTPAQIDSMDRLNQDLNFPFSLFMNKINSGNYEGFKSSGKIGNIENDSLRMKILSYYQIIAPMILETSNSYNQYLLKTADMLSEDPGQTAKNFYISKKMKSKFEYIIMLGKLNIKAYKEAPIHLATEIIKNIDKEVGVGK